MLNSFRVSFRPNRGYLIGRPRAKSSFRSEALVRPRAKIPFHPAALVRPWAKISFNPVRSFAHGRTSVLILWRIFAPIRRVFQPCRECSPSGDAPFHHCEESSPAGDDSIRPSNRCPQTGNVYFPVIIRSLQKR